MVKVISISKSEKPARRHLGPMAWAAALLMGRLWRHKIDREQLGALLGRYGAHLAILCVAVALGISTRIDASPSVDARSSRPPLDDTPQPLVTATPAMPQIIGYTSADQPRIVREARHLTTIPERERLNVITYTVQEGDSVFSIAESFKLSPYTIVWANMEILQGAPWLLQPGLPLYILPTDGAYHTVGLGETTSDIVAAYDVTLSALYNTWNAIEPDQPLSEGTQLVVPGGIGPDFDWEPPPPPTPVYVAAPDAGDTGVVAQSQLPAVSPSSSATANGWFVLPTGSYAVSGWVFHDPRKPQHIGLDYKCRLNDPIYATDGGTVLFAGWGGGYGNLVRLDHGNGFVTYYGHFNAFAVTSGQGVAQGQIIGYCGTTGYSTGPHLHYEIRLNGVPQNPALYEP